MTPQLGPAQPTGAGPTALVDPGPVREDARPEIAGSAPAPAPVRELPPVERSARSEAPEAPKTVPTGGQSIQGSDLAGPPPAFEASILDQLREEARNPELPPEPEQTADVAAILETPKQINQAAATPTGAAEGETEVTGLPGLPETAEPAPRSESESRYTVPPSAEVRAETEVATVRRIETPYDTATVDVSR